jgi:hypothetical protein
MRPNSIKIHQDSDAGLFATLTDKSTNRKTGDMQQVAILPIAESPEQAVKFGRDRGI